MPSPKTGFLATLLLLPVLAITVPAQAGHIYTIDRGGIKLQATIGDNVVVETTTPNSMATSSVANPIRSAQKLDFSQDQEVHEVVDSGARGYINARLNLNNNKLKVTAFYRNVSSPLLPIAGTPAHIHLGERGENGPVVFGLDVTPNAASNGKLSGTFTLTDEQVDSFLAGDYYVNLHTEKNPMGELRGQIEFE